MGQPPLITLWMYWPAGVLAAIALVVLYLALVRDRARGRLRCSGCWYDMSGIAALPARCPECGRAAPTRAALLKTRRSWWWAALAIIMLVPLCVVVSQLHVARVYYALMPRWKLTIEERSGGFSIRRYKIRDPDERGERIKVTGAGKTLMDWECVEPGHHASPTDEAALIDLNDDGVQEVLVTQYSRRFMWGRRVWVFQMQGNAAATVIDCDTLAGMGVRRVKPSDETLLFFSTRGLAEDMDSELPARSICYRLKDGAPRVALDEIERDAPRIEADLEAERRIINAKFEPEKGVVASDIWSTTLNLLYSSGETKAWRFYNSAWPDRAYGKEAALANFKTLLANDPYYQDLVAARAARDAGQALPPSKALQPPSAPTP